MVIKSGYKKTEIGIIPVDWDVKRVGDVSQTTSGGTPNTLISTYWGGDIRWMSSGELHQKFVYEVEGRITEEGLKNSSTKIIPEQCVLIGLAGQGKTRGTVAINMVELCTNQSIAAIFPSRNLIPLYLFYNLDNRYNELRDLSTGSGGRGGLNLLIINSLLIPIPKLPEQQAIAEVLSDVDNLLAALDALIAKKRAIKQGAMQQLLTGKIRLPGFSGEWEKKTIDEVTYCLDNLRIPLNDTQRMNMRGEFPYCGANGILDFISDYIIDDEVILIAEDGGYFDEFAYRPIAYKMSGKFWVNNHAHILKAKEGIDQDFIFYSLVHKNILPFITSGTRAKLNKYEMYKIEIFLPRERDEQASIAQALSALDEEIFLHEQKSSKLKLIKQGMMQELLTGKTRLL